jgi:hypothetical protein
MTLDSRARTIARSRCGTFERAAEQRHPEQIQAGGPRSLTMTRSYASASKQRVRRQSDFLSDATFSASLTPESGPKKRQKKWGFLHLRLFKKRAKSTY